MEDITIPAWLVYMTTVFLIGWLVYLTKGMHHNEKQTAINASDRETIKVSLGQVLHKLEVMEGEFREDIKALRDEFNQNLRHLQDRFDSYISAK